MNRLARHYAPTVTLEELTIAPRFGGGTPRFGGIMDLAPGLTCNWLVDGLDLTVPTIVVPRPSRIDVYPPEEIVPYVAETSLVRCSEMNVDVKVSQEEGLTETVTALFAPWAPGGD